MKVNGKYLKAKKLKIKFNKKTYKVKTNKKGVATWKVKKSMLKKLKVGKKYKYTVTYGKDVVTKKLTIIKWGFIISIYIFLFSQIELIHFFN